MAIDSEYSEYNSYAIFQKSAADPTLDIFDRLSDLLWCIWARLDMTADVEKTTIPKLRSSFQLLPAEASVHFA